MKSQQIDEIRSMLDQLRQDPKTKRKFPQNLWKSIIRLTKIYSIEDLCQKLNINPAHLKRKMRRTSEGAPEFREVSLCTLFPSDNLVKIEIRSKTGLSAAIQGPISCLNCLYHLFGE
jgi:hypothetical protein